MPERTYEIRVRGVAGTTTRSAFPDFEVATDGNDSVLRGRVADQAALFGVLGRLQGLGIELLELRIRTRDGLPEASGPTGGHPGRRNGLPVLVVNSRRSCRASIGKLIDTQPDLVLIGEAATVGDAVGGCVRPRVVLADLDLADVSGPAVVEALQAGFEGSAIVVQVGPASTEAVPEVLAAGVEGVITHDATAAELLLAVRTAARGRTYLQPAAAAALVQEQGDLVF
jgi:CheY-like chemotaxis protein